MVLKRGDVPHGIGFLAFVGFDNLHIRISTAWEKK